MAIIAPVARGLVPQTPPRHRVDRQTRRLKFGTSKVEGDNRGMEICGAPKLVAEKASLDALSPGFIQLSMQTCLGRILASLSWVANFP